MFLNCTDSRIIFDYFTRHFYHYTLWVYETRRFYSQDLLWSRFISISQYCNGEQRTKLIYLGQIVRQIVNLCRIGTFSFIIIRFIYYILLIFYFFWLIKYFMTMFICRKKTGRYEICNPIKLTEYKKHCILLLQFNK